MSGHTQAEKIRESLRASIAYMNTWATDPHRWEYGPTTLADLRHDLELARMALRRAMKLAEPTR